MKPILVVDDDPRMLMMLRRGLAFEGHTVIEAKSGSEALQKLRENDTQLVILDIMMPGLSGLQVLQKIRQAPEHIPVILLTARDKPHEQVEGLDFGADDYITKPFSFEVLLARIRLLLRKQQPRSLGDLHFQDVRMDLRSHQVHRNGRPLSLTPLEFKVLQTLLENPGKVFSKPMLLDRVWGLDFFGEVNVVEVTVYGLRQKMEAQGESRLVHTIRGAGYVLKEE